MFAPASDTRRIVVCSMPPTKDTISSVICESLTVDPPPVASLAPFSDGLEGEAIGSRDYAAV